LGSHARVSALAARWAGEKENSVNRARTMKVTVFFFPGGFIIRNRR
jgi:hypothetical protein